MLLATCERADHGLLITLDDVEKADVDDVSALSNAFQMASRKGRDIMLAIAGLPNAHARIIHHDGCSFLRRAPHEELALLTWEKADEAFSDIFGHIEGLTVRDEEKATLNEASYGHPYLMQLLSHYLMLLANQKATGERYVTTAQDVQDAIAAAKTTFEQRVLSPLVEECSDAEFAYLQAMSACLDDERLVSTDEVARLQREQRQLSRVREGLIDAGIIAAPEHGKVMFCVPLLADYVSRAADKNPDTKVARRRCV